MTQSRLTSIDVTLLTLLMLAQCIGYVAAVWALSWWIKAASFLLFETVLLAWIAGWSPAAQIWPNLRHTIRLQLHAAAQILPGMYFIGGSSILSNWIIVYVKPNAPWNWLLNPDTIVQYHHMALTLCLLLAQLLGAARVHALHRNGLSLSAVLAGALNDKEYAIPAPPADVRDRLRQYLDGLGKAGAPTMSRLWYGRKPSVNSAADLSDSAQAYLVHWRDCPARIRMTVACGSDGGSLLRMRCELRGGQHRLDGMVNPIDALALMEFMQANVVQPLASELTLSRATARQDELRLHAVEMQLRVLQAQIEPHFLFNTLANVRQLYRTSVTAGEDMMDHLIMYLRCSMHEMRAERSSVSREFELVLHYLAIMKIRMGERLSYSFIEPDHLKDHPFPPAMLITLVENALVHGLHDRPDGTLTISAARDDRHVRVTVIDNGAGFSSVEGTGTGLSNIRQRLEALYGNRAWLEVGALHDGGFMSSIVVPFLSAETLPSEKP